MKYYYLLPKSSHVGTPIDLLQWSALLRSSDGFEMYRQVHGTLNIKGLVAFLLLDRSFPRSTFFSLQRVEDCLHNITGCDINYYSNEAERLVGIMRSKFQYTQVDEVLQIGLHEYLDKFQIQINDLGQEVHKSFFALSEKILN